MAITFNVTKGFQQIDSAGDGFINNAGETITYSISITNGSTAGETFDALAMNDPLLGLAGFDLLAAEAAGELNLSGDDGDLELEPGETWTFTEDTVDHFTYTVTQDDLDSNGTAEPNNINVGLIDNVASITGTRLNGETFTASGSAGVGVVLEPEIDIEKATNGQDADDPTGPVLAVGDTATFTYEVTNPGNVALDNVVVTDDNGTPGDTADDFSPTFTGGDTDGDGRLDVDETWTYEATRTVTEGQFTNESTVAGTDPAGTDVNDMDPSNHFGSDPDIDIEKATNGENADDPTGPVLAVGDTATFTYEVNNTGNVALSDVVVTDDNGTPGDTSDDFSPTFTGGDTDGDGLLDVDETWTYEAERIVTEGQFTNESTVEGTDPAGTVVEDDDPSNHFGSRPGIDIEKATNGQDADDPTGPVLAVGDTATFTYEVNNTGNVALSDVVVTDDNGTPGDTSDDFSPTFTGGDTDGDGLLDVDETWTYEASRTVTRGQFTNKGTAVGTDPAGTDVNDMDPSNHFGSDPDIDIEKATNGEDADNPTGPVLAVGETATFTYAVTTGDGNVALSDVVVVDDNGTPGDTADDFSPTFTGGDTDGDGLLDVGETWTYEAERIVTEGQFTNNSTVEGTGPAGQVVEDEDPSNHFGQAPVEPGGANTIGFWKNHEDIFEQELANEGLSPDDLYEDVFSVDLTGGLDGITLEQALEVRGGHENQLVKQSTAALANAASDEASYSYIGFETELEAAGVLATLLLIDGSTSGVDNGVIEIDEIFEAVQDALDDDDALNDFFSGKDGIEDVKDAFDAMNNVLPEVDAMDFAA